MTSDDSTLDSCGCCEGPLALTSTTPSNPPGLSALSYRIGTHGRFNAQLQTGLAVDPALRALATRDSSDPAMALLDAWATVLDVLTFYQERIANEGFIRTATERRSVLELARAIGYELRPGVAAGTCLAFTMDNVTGSPETVQLAIGTKAQSVPGQDEKPQIFETTEEIEARPAWNAIVPQQYVSSLPLKLGSKKVYLQGTATGLLVGDALLFIGDERKGDSGNENWDFRRVAAIETVSFPPTEGANAGYTIVTLDHGLGTFMPPVTPTQKNPEVYALRQRAAIFGYNATDWKALPDKTKAAYLGIDESELTDDQKAEWPDFTIFSTNVAASGARFMQRSMQIPATVEQVAAAATTSAHSKATAAAAAAAQAGLALVSSGAALGQSAFNLADKTAKALEDVAKKSAGAVHTAITQSLETQLRSVSSFVQTASNQAAIEGILNSVKPQVLGLLTTLQGSMTTLDPATIIRTVLDAVTAKLDELRNEIIGDIASAAIDKAKGAVDGLKTDIGALITEFGDALVRALAAGSAGPIIELTLNRASRAITDVSGSVASGIAGYLEGGHLVDPANDVFKKLKDRIEATTIDPANSIQALFDIATGPVRVAGFATEAAQKMIRSAAGFAYGALSQAHANLTTIADQVSQAAIGVAKVVNPDDVIAEVSHAAETLRQHAEAAALAGHKSVGAAISASIVTAAVKLALDAPEPLPKPTPESIAEVAKLFGDASVALLQAAEGATPPLVNAAINSPVGQMLGDTFSVAAQAISAARTFVNISDAPVNGARETVEEINRSTQRALLGTTGFKKSALPKVKLASAIDLDLLYPKIVAGKGWLVLSTPEYQEVFKVAAAAESARAEFNLSGKTTLITLGAGENLDKFSDKLRTTMVYAQSEELQFAEKPRIDNVSGGEILLDPSVADLTAGRLLSITGNDADTGESAAEIAEIQSVEETADGTLVTLTADLSRSYARDTVTINANVARATHGETKSDEILGSGDGSIPFQKFTLKQKPLTFVSAPVAGGAETTLEVRVKDVLWHEVPSFYEVASTDRSYVTRRADDGTVTVQFGDGVTGARPPTGANNLTATYRVGIGLDGNVDADVITTLLSRPLGLKAVTNPIPATGAGDPEELADAQVNAPLTVLTLDRIVSVQDFEDFARAFAGIGKGQATLLWNGERQLVHLTVAAADGTAVDPTSEFFQNLIAGIDAARHADQPVIVSPHEPLTFNLIARVAVDPDYVKDDVLAAVKTALVDAFSFAERGFGQGVASSEVLAIMQNVEGVVAVDLDKLDGHDPITHPNVPARIAYWNGTAFKGAELLLIDADDITLNDLPL